jgi:hypothetical protein
MINEIENLSLHDSTLLSIRADWEERTCTVEIDSFDSRIVLTFKSVNHIDIPIKMPWGQSISIDEASKVKEKVWSIQMQSGDLITIKAETAETKKFSNKRVNTDC